MAGNCLHRYWTAAREYAEWRTAKPIQLAVDLSRINTSRTSFTKTYSTWHFTELRLQLEKPLVTRRGLLSPLHGLDAYLTIRDTNGNVQFEHSASESDWRYSGTDSNAVPVFNPIFRLFKGTYLFELSIKSPVLALRDNAQAVVFDTKRQRYHSKPSERAIIAFGIWCLIALVGGAMFILSLRKLPALPPPDAA